MNFQRNAFRKSVASYRLEKGLALRQAAELAKISSSTLCRVELGRSIDIDTFCTLCKWIGQKPSAFFA